MNERYNSIETREKESFGQNVEIRALFLRHGPKDPETWHLTADGVVASGKYGERFSATANGDIYLLKAYSSEIGRAQETTEAIIENVNTDRKGQTRVRLELGEKDEDAYFSTKALTLPYSEYIKQSRREENVGGKIISLHQLAQRVANQIDGFIRMSKRLKSDSRVDLINITHLPWIAAFMKEAIGQELETEEDQDKKKEIENKITDLGFLDGFEVTIKRDGERINLSLKIGDSEFDLKEEVISDILEN